MIAPYFLELFDPCLFELAVLALLFLLLIDLVLPSDPLLLLLFLLALEHWYFLGVNEGLRNDLFFLVEVRPFPVVC